MYFKSVSIYFFFNIISALLPIVTLPIFTRYLSPSDYGVLAIFNIANMFAGNLFRMEINSALKKQYSENKEDFSRYLGTAFVFSNLILLFFGFVLVVCLPWLIDFHGVTVSWFFLILLLSYLRFQTVILHHLLQLTNRAFLFGVWGFVATFATFGIALALLALYGLGWQARAWAEVVVAVASFPIALYFLKRDFFLKWQFDFSSLKTMLHFSLPLLITSMIGYLLMTSDRLFIGKMVGTKELGLYSIAVQLASLTGLFFGAVQPVWESWLYKIPGGVSSHSIGKIARRFFSIVAVALIVLIILPPVVGWMLPYITDKNFEGARAYIVPTMLAAGSTGMFGLLVSILIVMQRTTIVARFCVALLFVCMFLLFFFVKQWGAVGAAYALTITYLTGSLLVLNYVFQYCRRTTFSSLSS